MDTRLLTTFPTEGQPSPRIIPIDHLRNLPSREVHASARLIRWWCCRCVEAGFEDFIGTDIDSADPCFVKNCHHTRCHNCLAGPNHIIQDAVRTLGGLHASPRFIDPVYWECPCGEWEKNRFSEAHATMGMSLCASQTCKFRYRSPRTSTLRPDSIVLNGYGQRLGTADQTVAVEGGPWHWQRMGLADGANALLETFRERIQQKRSLMHTNPQHSLMQKESSTQAQGMLPPPTRSRVESYNVIWQEGEPAPRYPFRPPPPTLAPPSLSLSAVKTTGVMNSHNKRRNVMDGAPDDENPERAYKMAYLAGIRRDPMMAICDSGGSGGGIGRGGNDMAGRAITGMGNMSPSSGFPSSMRPTPGRSHLSSGPTVGTADHVQIQMQMHMGLPTTMTTTQAQAATKFITRW